MVRSAYIYNVATKTFITGKTATVKNIENADVRTIDGDKTRCFTCDNKTKDHLFLEYIYIFPVHQWHAEVSDDRKATDFTIVKGSTKNSYKLTKYKKITLNGSQTAYFSVSGEKYAASLEPSYRQRLVFHFCRPKDVYAEYTSLFTEAASLLKNEKLNDQESVRAISKLHCRRLPKVLSIPPMLTSISSRQLLQLPRKRLRTSLTVSAIPPTISRMQKLLLSIAPTVPAKLS